MTHPPPAGALRTPYEACPLCGSAAVERFVEADCSRHALFKPPLNPTLVWARCTACGHVFTDSYFTEQGLALVFSETQKNQQVGFDLERQRAVSARIVARVARHRAGGGWVDVGFGNGALVLTAAEWGYQAVGLDLREKNVEALRRLGAEAHAVTLEAYRPQEPPSVISMADVLEHVPYPRQTLAAAEAMLAAGGVLFLSMPAYASPLWRLLDGARANPYWGELEHYHNFSRERLIALAAEFGFAFQEYDISERYRACMELIFRKAGGREAAAS